jgi:hypothetical protein
MNPYENVKLIMWLVFLDAAQIAIHEYARTKSKDPSQHAALSQLASTCKSAYIRIMQIAQIAEARDH